MKYQLLIGALQQNPLGIRPRDTNSNAVTVKQVLALNNNDNIEWQSQCQFEVLIMDCSNSGNTTRIQWCLQSIPRAISILSVRNRRGFASLSAKASNISSNRLHKVRHKQCYQKPTKTSSILNHQLHKGKTANFIDISIWSGFKKLLFFITYYFAH